MSTNGGFAGVGFDIAGHLRWLDFASWARANMDTVLKTLSEEEVETDFSCEFCDG